MRVIARAVAVAAAASLAVLACGSGPAAAATPDVSASIATWDLAAARLGVAGSLWEPRHTPDLDRSRRITVVSGGITVADGRVTGGTTFASTRFGRGSRTLLIEEKWADTGWAVRPTTSRPSGLVRTVRLTIGPRGARSVVPARVYANCAERARCTARDVRRYGGRVELTAVPAPTMTAPGRTTVVLTSTGLSFAELVAVAGSLEQVAGAPAGGAGSAQMLGMCRQMVSGAMTAAQAEQLAVSSGYSVRVGSIDGQPQPVTADYRPDRFTVSVTADAVTSCTYG